MSKSIAVGEEMTKNLVTIRDNEKMEEAYRLMFANKIRHLPVIDARGEVAGIISDRDVQRAMASNISDSFGFKMESIKFNEGAKVVDYMTWPVKTFSRSADILEVIQEMLDKKLSAFLITDEKGVVGIVTTDDFLHLLKNLLEKDTDDEIYLLGDVLTSPMFGRMANMIGNAGI